MSRFYSHLSLVLLSFVSASALAASISTTTVERHIIVTPVPAPKEVIIIPAGSDICYTVAANFVKDDWFPERKICQYKSDKSWVDSYWKCTAFKVDTGECITWDWVPAHWVDLY